MTEKQEPASPPLPKDCTCGMYGGELLPCPFCGNKTKPTVFAFDGEPYVPGFVVRCDASGWEGMEEKGCGAEAGWGETQAEAIAVWSRRPTPVVGIPTTLDRTAGETIGGGVQIKPLEWREDDDDGRPMWRARTDTGQVYTVYDDGFSNPPLLLCLHQLKLGSFRSIDPAKAAAQADFEARILSALAPPPGEPAQGVTEAMVEAFQAKYREIAERCNWSHSWPAGECVREMLDSALAAAPEGSTPVTEALRKLAATIDLSNAPDDAEVWIGGYSTYSGMRDERKVHVGEIRALAKEKTA